MAVARMILNLAAESELNWPESDFCVFLTFMNIEKKFLVEMIFPQRIRQHKKWHSYTSKKTEHAELK
jgi:hypothetical protein